MIDTGAITGKKAEEQEPTPVQQQEQVPEPEKVQEPTQEQPQEAPAEEQAEKEPEYGSGKEPEQAEQGQEQQEQDTIFNGMSYIELIATAFMLGSLVLLVLTRSEFSIKAFGISILVAFLIECCKPMRK